MQSHIADLTRCLMVVYILAYYDCHHNILQYLIRCELIIYVKDNSQIEEVFVD